MRNKKLDAAKAIAACFVVFIHIGFPDRTGEIIRALARFAVPFFFMISGYFCYYEGGGAVRKIPRKMKHIAKLALWSVLFYFFWELLMHILEKQSVYTWLLGVFQEETLKDFALYNATSAVKMHLWFLPALIYCYVLVYFIEKLHMRKAAYCFIVVLLGICMWRAWICRLFGGFYHTMQYRNYLFTGMPFFLLGEWIRERQEKEVACLQENKAGFRDKRTGRKAVWGMSTGIVWTIFEYCRMGEREIYAGTVIFTVSLFLWTVSESEFPKDSQKIHSRNLHAFDQPLNFLADIGKNCGFYIYLFHLAVADILKLMMKACSLEKNLFWLWTRPVLVCGLTITVVSFGPKLFRQIAKVSLNIFPKI